MTRILHPLIAVVLFSALPACGSSTTVLEDGTGGGGGSDSPQTGPVGPGTGGGTGEGGGQTGGCLSNAQCIDDNGGLPYVCRQGGDTGPCSPVLSDDCVLLAGSGDALEALRDERVVLLGALLPLSGADAAVGDAQANAIELAFDELSASAGGVPGADGETMPVVAVICDELVAPAAAARHLTSLGVSLVIGPFDGAPLMSWAPEVAIPQDVMVLSPSTDHPALEGMDDAGLVWQVRSSAAHGGALADVSARLEPQLGDGPLRVAFIAGDDAPSQAMAATFLDTLVLNGVSAEANVESGDLIVITMASSMVPEATVAIVEMAPDLVVVALPDASDLIEAVETSLAPPPAWLASLSPHESGSLANGLEGRFFGVQTGGPLDDALRVELGVRYASSFGDAPSFAAIEAYDAAYLAFFALAASAPSAHTGSSLSAAVTRLVASGADVRVGPADLNAGFAALAAGGGIDLQGATGSLDADLATGSFPRSIEVLCAGADGLEASGLVVDEAGDLVGSSTCL